MKKTFVFIAVASVLAVSATSAQAADDNAVVKGAKKVGCAITWPFKKIGGGFKKVFKKGS